LCQVNHIAHRSFWEWGNVKGKDPSSDERCDLQLAAEEKSTEDKPDSYPRDEKIRPRLYATIYSHDIIDGTWIPVDRSLRVILAKLL
jgi:hypothetical protein